MEPARKYPATNISAETREALASIAYGLVQEGKTQKDVCDLYRRSGYPISKQTLSAYIGKIESGDPPLSHAKRSGKNSSLSEREIELLCGFVLWKIEEKK